ncbi:type II secretion system F family protein [Kineococcus sp. SYSU DK001]|uniref:type II secretion system F family protein n=1 Tax=Kineococcus sp. SYSU DK001 TaxID=3383122 RepID=UPI003D7D9D43
MTAAAPCVAVLLAAAVLVRGDGGGDGGPPRLPPWVRRPRRSGPPPPQADAALLCDLVAAAVGAGLPPGRALTAALEALAREGYARVPELDRAAVRLSWGQDPQEFADALGTGPWDDLAEPLLLSARTGAPAASLLSSAAGARRARRRWEAEAAAARLSATLVLPLGLCTLPAFLLLGVVPVVLGLAREVLS